MIDGVRIDSDEDGFVLILEGDLTDAAARHLGAADGTSDAGGMRLRLPQDAAIQLLAQARAEIGPWAAEMESERRAYNAASPEERARVTGMFDYALDDEREQLAVAGDHARKAARENG